MKKTFRKTIAMLMSLSMLGSISVGAQEIVIPEEELPTIENIEDVKEVLSQFNIDMEGMSEEEINDYYQAILDSVEVIGNDKYSSDPSAEGLSVTTSVWTGYASLPLGKYYGDFKYIIINDEAWITHWKGKTPIKFKDVLEEYVANNDDAPILEIPSEINGYPVVGIGGNAIDASHKVGTVIIPNTVREIGASNYAYRWQLKNPEQPSQVENVCFKIFGMTYPHMDKTWIDEESLFSILKPEYREEYLTTVVDDICSWNFIESEHYANSMLSYHILSNCKENSDLYNMVKDKFINPDIPVYSYGDNTGIELSDGTIGVDSAWALLNAFDKELDNGTAKLLTVEEAENAIRARMGDANFDGDFDVRDLSSINAHLTKNNILEDKAVRYADFNSDGKVDLNDLAICKKCIVGLDSNQNYCNSNPIF